jgi:hypothetical protein
LEDDLVAIFDALFRAAVITAYTVGSASMMDAAEIRVDPSRTGTSGAVFEGKIEAGDFDKFKNFVLNGNNPVEIYLASPGGNLAEAMKIGLLVRILKLSTVVPSKAVTNHGRFLAATRHNLKDPNADYMCASACFFIFVAAIHRSSDNLGPAILGIHMPFLSNDDLKKLNLERATAAEDRIRTTVDNYLKIMDVPSKYAENMYSVPKGKIQWIRNDEFDADFAGFIPELRDSIRARCGSAGDVEKKNSEQPSDVSIKRSQAARLNCERSLQDKLALDAYDSALKRRNGQIPSSTPEGLLATPQK